MPKTVNKVPSPSAIRKELNPSPPPKTTGTRKQSDRGPVRLGIKK